MSYTIAVISSEPKALKWMKVNLMAADGRISLIAEHIWGRQRYVFTIMQLNYISLHTCVGSCPTRLGGLLPPIDFFSSVPTWKISVSARLLRFDIYACSSCGHDTDIFPSFGHIKLNMSESGGNTFPVTQPRHAAVAMRRDNRSLKRNASLHHYCLGNIMFEAVPVV